jgi:outer membrane protein TolC
MTTQSSRHSLVFAVLGAVLVPSAASAQSAVIAAGAPATTIDTPSAPESPASREDGPVLDKLTFDVAIKRALDRNPTSLEAAAEIRRYSSLMEQVRASSLPTLSAAAAYTRLDANRVAGALVLEPENGLNLSATLSAPLVNVRGWVQWQQAGDQVDVARLTAADVRRTLAVTAGRAYLTVIKERRLLETARTARDNAKAHYDFTHTQLLGGIGNRLDDARAAQELTTDEVILQNQESALFHAREALGVLVVGEGAMDADEWTFGPMPQLNDGLNDAQSLRTDVRTRRAAAKAADRAVNQAYADYLPYLNLVASPFYQNPAVPTVPQTGWQAALVLGVLLYDGGLRYGQEHERSALAEEGHLQVEATLRQARSDVRAAFEEMQRADIALGQAHQSARFATAALGLADLAYRGGATTNLEVIDAARQARDAETQAAVSEDAAREARLDLLAATGRFP